MAISRLRGGGGGDASGVVWTPIISQPRVNDETVNSGSVSIYTASYIKTAVFADFFISFGYTPATGKVPYSATFRFTFPSELTVNDFYGSTYINHTANGDVYGAAGGGVVGAVPGDFTTPFTRAIAVMGIGPFPDQVRSDSFMSGDVRGRLLF